tara:strand:+ start:2319 stop:3413 length:1095 start_codon:yes stop_codon:yes gene_type:complete
MEIKVKAVESVEEKSTQQIEQELLEKHEQKQNETEDSATVEVEETDIETEPTESSQLNEEDVLSFIKNRYEKEFTSVDQLFEEKESNEELPEDVKAYFDYKKTTGRGIEDYVKLSKDFSSMDEDQLLSEYLIASGEATDSEDVEVLMDDYSYDEEIDEEKDIKKIKLIKKKAIAKARKFFEEQKEMYKQPLESSTVGISNDLKEELEEYKQYLNTAKSSQEELTRKRNWFVDKTNEVFQDFKGFDFNVGDSTLTFNPGDADKVKEAQLDSSVFVRKFMDKDTGLINDAEGYHRSLAIAMNPERFASFFYEQGKTDATEDVTRKMKNVDMTERRTPQVARTKDGLQIKSISAPSSRGLKIKSKKK